MRTRIVVELSGAEEKRVRELAEEKGVPPEVVVMCAVKALVDKVKAEGGKGWQGWA